LPSHLYGLGLILGGILIARREPRCAGADAGSANGPDTQSGAAADADGAAGGRPHHSNRSRKAFAKRL
jgi:hypothetical protein